MKPITKSTTTQNVATSGAAGAAALTLVQILCDTFPNAPVLSHEYTPTVAVWGTTVIVVPILSRFLARWRKKS